LPSNSSLPSHHLLLAAIEAYAESIEEEEGESDPQLINLSQDGDNDSSQIDNYTQIDGKRRRGKEGGG
jgi:hypothetical protein